MSKTVRIPNKRRRAKPLVLLVLVAALSVALWKNNTATPLLSALARVEPGTYLVSYVDDGDTIRVRDSLGQTNTVRFIGIDTPEVKDPRKPVQCFGQAASDYTKHALSGQRVRLVSDPLSGDRDKYNRLLRYVYLQDGTFFNAKLVSDGYAFAYTVFINNHTDEFVALESQARQQNRGLWAGCGVDATTRIKQTTAR